MKNRIIIASLLSLSIFAFGSFFINELMVDDSSSYSWNYDGQSAEDDMSSLLSPSVDVDKATQIESSTPVDNGSSYSESLMSEPMSVMSSSSFSSLANQSNHSSNGMSMTRNSSFGFSGFSNKGGRSNLLVSNGSSGGHTSDNSGLGGLSTDFTGGPFAAPGFSGGTILIDPMTDPDESSRIPIGNASWLLVLLAGAYAGKKIF